MNLLFQDREQAGHELAKRIDWLLKKKGLLEISDVADDLLVLAIPRGGIILGDVIATFFRCDLDIIVSRKIRAEFNEEFAIGAVMPDGTYFVNEKITNMFNLSEQYLEKEIKYQKQEILRRLNEFRGSTSYENKLQGKIVILVDDGIATGATIIASAKWIKNNHDCKSLIVAVPVAPARDETVEKLNEITDHVVIPYLEENFSAVGQFYKIFDQVSDNTVKTIMRRYHYDV